MSTYAKIKQHYEALTNGGRTPWSAGVALDVLTVTFAQIVWHQHATVQNMYDAKQRKALEALFEGDSWGGEFMLSGRGAPGFSVDGLDRMRGANSPHAALIAACLTVYTRRFASMDLATCAAEQAEQVSPGIITALAPGVRSSYIVSIQDIEEVEAPEEEQVLTAGVLETLVFPRVGDTVVVLLHDSNGNPIKRIGILQEILEILEIE